MIRIGKIAGTHGLQGDVVLTHVVGHSGWLKKDTVLFLELRKGSYIPYFLTDLRVIGDEEIIVHLEDLNSVEEAKKLSGKAVYLQEDILKEEKTDSPLLWIGFSMVDKTRGSLGVIEDVYQAGPQWLAKLTISEKEVLVPLVPQFILDVNTRNQFIRVDLPEGLIEVYLG